MKVPTAVVTLTKDMLAQSHNKKNTIPVLASPDVFKLPS
jgi:hypothetical protein